MGSLQGRKKGILVVIVSLLAVARLSTTAASGSELVSALCNSALYSFGDPFGKNLGLVLDDLLGTTPGRDFKDYTAISPRPSRFVYGHAKCRHALSAGECGVCLKGVAAALADQCGNAVGGRAMFVDCFMRYEAYPFGDEEPAWSIS
ncbi:hypothetical protein SELMODRAFT_83250 [Selaginella moellendorffii]|uniref:Gnk2-homologous domain-containing protein n=1 Tax=Selaginella moellendorffii TaxID=88036 RepID=D8R1N8_SELML|nr:antifungal protein ginkbilobin-2 [Selaginella moellendorffii]EFJ33923.1 hypothetical protein SELMODRAFT_83250 [Selaginella moellendorffii]|eukprot:XP_002965085.1 antifungal protein ginkbilobin-2 [Selaginella moellendorffii]